MARGTLRVYLGAAPGVGKTYRMLDEARRRAGRGADVVVGVVETHGREHTATMAEGFETIPRRTVEHRGATFTEMDLDALLLRAPKVAIVDELAHTNVPGSRNAKRWEDVDELLRAGIDVITTVNVQHLESLGDVVLRITGVPQRETIPDDVVRRADQVELVDMAAEALRRRMAHGNVYAADKVDAAMSSYFRPGNLNALRELALLWVADRVDEVLRRYRTEHDIDHTWETRERVVVALPGGVEGETLLRRAARIADRGGGEVLALHVARSDGLAAVSPAALARQRTLADQLGASFHTVVGDDVPRALLAFARSEDATQLVLGASRRGRVGRFLGGEGVGERTIRLSGEVDVHIVTHDRVRTRRLPRLGGGLSPRRRAAGLGVAVLGLPALTALLLALSDRLALQSALLTYLAFVVVVALVGGAVPALVAAVAATLLANWFLTPPTGTFTVADPDSLVGLAVFVVVAVSVSSVVDLAARRSRQAARARAEAATLGAVASRVVRGGGALPSLLTQLVETFGLRTVALEERADADAPWEVVATAGGGEPDASEHPATAGAAPETVGAGTDSGTQGAAPTGAAPPTPTDERTVVAVDGRRRLVGVGPRLRAEDRRVLVAFATQAAQALETERLSERAGDAETLAKTDRMRTALLAAVGHDLRTPLAGIKAGVSSLRSGDVAFSEDDRDELLRTIEESADRLTVLVADLLDMSRLRTGALQVDARPVGLDEVVPGALRDLPADAPLRLDVPETLPAALADPVLLERVVANLLGNAVRHAPPGSEVLVQGVAIEGQVQLRVADRGPGVPPERREQIFAPFQRLDDRDPRTGIGLGLAVARGFAEAMGGTLEAEDTPGGGLTVLLELPAESATLLPAPAPGTLA